LRCIAPCDADIGEKVNLNNILRELRAERDRIDQAIAILERLQAYRSGEKVPWTPPPRRGRKSMGAAERQAVSKRMKSYWLSRRSR
jgi:hypothetical protein